MKRRKYTGPPLQLMLAIDDAMDSRKASKIEPLIQHEVRQSNFAIRSFILAETSLVIPRVDAIWLGLETR